jgi:hypothetical protein
MWRVDSAEHPLIAFRSMRRLLLSLLFSLPVVGQEARVYSDVREVEETGDLVGIELRLEIAGETATAALRHYEGAEPAPIRMTGQLVGSALTLSGTYAEGNVEIIARIQKDRVTGKLLYHLGGQTNEVALNVPRVKRPRMQKTGIAHPDIREGPVDLIACRSHAPAPPGSRSTRVLRVFFSAGASSDRRA